MTETIGSFLMEEKMYIRSQILLRIMVSLAALAATLVMVLNKQTIDFAGYPLEASYKLSPAFKFYVGAHAAVIAYLVLSLPFISNLVKGCILHPLDMIIMVLMVAAVTAGTTIGYVAKKGNNDVGWVEVCSYFGKFCTKTVVSLIFAYAGLILFLLMCVLSSPYKSKSRQHNNV